MLLNFYLRLLDNLWQKKEELREIRSGTVINKISKKQETALKRAVDRIKENIKEKYPDIELRYDKQWKLVDIVTELKNNYPSVDFTYFFDSSSMRPDGGIISIVSKSGKKLPILISEKKNQGTNDLRESEGKRKQAKGNAVERLGKNVIGFRIAMKPESIFPFVCFGDGVDFSDDSSILDRVVTIAQFGDLNKIYLHNQEGGIFDRGSFYFRPETWTENEMYEICKEIAERSIHYYLSKYGKKDLK